MITVAQAQEAAAQGDCKTLLQVFAQDVEAIGVTHIQETWPDLHETYTQAKHCLKNIKE